MASGSFYVDTSNPYIRGEVTWSSTADVVNNRSSVTVTLKFSRTNTGYTTYRTPTCYIRIGESSSSYNEYACDENGSSITITYLSHTFCGDSTRNVAHNADGTGSAYIRISGILGTDYTLDTTAQTVTLDTIPRASIITAFSCPDIAGSASVNISATTTSYSNTFNLDFKLMCGSTIIVDYGAIGAWTNITASGGSGQVHTLALTATQQDSILALIPNAASATLTLYCRTQSGTTNIGNPQTKTGTANVAASVVPSFATITNSELVAAVNTIVGKYVQNLSNIRLTITGAVGAKSSTITGYTITYNGANYSGSTMDTGIVSWSGNLTITGKVTDSRGRTATQNVVLNALAYAVPNISTFTVQRCTSGGGLDETGSYVKVVRTATASSLINTTEKNTVQAKVYYKDHAGVSPASFTEIANMTVAATSNVNSGVSSTPIVSTTGICLANKSYDFMLEIIDKFNTTLSYLVLATGTVVMSWGQTGVGIGKVQENGILDIAGGLSDVYLNGTKLFDAIYPVGSVYISVSSTSPATLFGGTWERIQDTFLLAAGTTYTAGATGGAATHTLTTAETPAHTHGVGTLAVAGGSHEHSVRYKGFSITASSSGFMVLRRNDAADAYDGTDTDAAMTDASHAHTLSGSTASAGSGSAHNNMPPYFAVYVWKRTA